ncbi:acetyltransferase [Streptomyces viridochromogenes DSM 40736]|uniref:Acetyltransferase n=1 Tax=Streptomyces viridochromogenes (strain DSM 40736 / JCM 4977 / BCRC 1201 / Tue 494) TaxID=591159 RepID=D9X8L4_STRVT|nr:GNAT family N-acetyltransferase [Streptomyces viridochromogenes]EFL36268.1 acetyltransferase [Streptomyces viridochromogenes DSM 40736]
MIVDRLDAARLAANAGPLADLLADTVNAGASVGFLAPLDRAEARSWWEERAADVATGRLALWAAYDGDRVLGTVSLAFPGKANSRHRAELVKLMVHRDTRGRGLGRRLLGVAEDAAAAADITLLHLDTETGSPAEHLYRSAGWTAIGAIPDYAASPGGELRPTTIYYKQVPAGALTR